MIGYYNAKQASATLRSVLKRAGVTVTKIYTKTEPGGTLFTEVEFAMTSTASDVRVRQALTAAGCADVRVTTVGKTPTAYARSRVRKS